MSLTLRDGSRWFREDLYSSVAHEFKIRKVLYRRIKKKGRRQSKFEIFDTEQYGVTFLLNGAIQMAEIDESSYAEALVHFAANSCSRPPRQVLIIGCGSALREVVKYPSVKVVDVIDEDYLSARALMKFFPSAFSGVKEAQHRGVRITYRFVDPLVYVKRLARRGKKYDLIIIDSPDPVDARDLFTLSFYHYISRILSQGGVVSRQTGSSVLQPEEMPANVRHMREVFPRGDVQVIVTAVAAYIGGYFTIVAASNRKGIFKDALHSVRARCKSLPLDTLRWYSPDIHKAAMILPKEMQRLIEQAEFGKELLLDLRECDHERINSPELLREFAQKICKEVNMKPVGPPRVLVFGHATPRTVGPSVIQLIETSNILTHNVPFWRLVLQNLFTCSTLDVERAVEFSMDFFGAERAQWEIRVRGRQSSVPPRTHTEHETVRTRRGFEHREYLYRLAEGKN